MLVASNTFVAVPGSNLNDAFTRRIMKTLARVAALAAVSLASIGVASAATIGSFGALVGSGGVATPPGTFINTALTAGSVGGAATYNIGTGGGIWTAPTGGSSWVGANALDCPNCGNVEPNGTINFYSTFTASSTSTGTITVMADDTTSVFLNGTLITAAAGSATAGKCTIGTPNCTTPQTYTLSGFLNGTNTLTFGVQQIYGNANGVDFSGVVNASAVPEPSSLMLLGTGLVGASGMFFRRLRA